MNTTHSRPPVQHLTSFAHAMCRARYSGAYTSEVVLMEPRTQDDEGLLHPVQSITLTGVEDIKRLYDACEFILNTFKADEHAQAIYKAGIDRKRPMAGVSINTVEATEK